MIRRIEEGVTDLPQQTSSGYVCMVPERHTGYAVDRTSTVASRKRKQRRSRTSHCRLWTPYNTCSYDRVHAHADRAQIYLQFMSAMSGEMTRVSPCANDASISTMQDITCQTHLHAQRRYLVGQTLSACGPAGRFEPPPHFVRPRDYSPPVGNKTNALSLSTISLRMT